MSAEGHEPSDAHLPSRWWTVLMKAPSTTGLILLWTLFFLLSKPMCTMFVLIWVLWIDCFQSPSERLVTTAGLGNAECTVCFRFHVMTLKLSSIWLTSKGLSQLHSPTQLPTIYEDHWCCNVFQIFQVEFEFMTVCDESVRRAHIYDFTTFFVWILTWSKVISYTCVVTGDFALKFKFPNLHIC